MNNNVYLCDTKDSYDFEEFSVKDIYNELKTIDISIASDKQVYNDVRNLFINMELDKENIGTKKWNPFKDFIKAGDTVLIKPNLVMHENGAGTTDCMITNFSIIRPVIDYCILALNNTGKIIVGDAPVQDCDFDKLKQINNLEENILKYTSVYKNISLVDFRKNQNPSIQCEIVKLNEYSSFIELDSVNKEYSITNYNLELMNKHHSNGVHEYIVPKDVLNADVIINMPKPKTHRKAGMTACMKNFVGINGNKECLPHHRTGGPKKNGDEFPEDSLIKNIYSWLSRFTYTHNKVLMFIRKIFSYLLKILKIDRFREGSWYGNDTIWRTILDLNKLIMFTDKDGNFTEKPQRKIFNVVDMVISGEKEGPLLPSDKKVGLVLAGFNQLNLDYIIAKIMGFNPELVKYIKNGYKMKKFTISNSKKFAIIGNDKNKVNIKEYNKHFEATDGWKDILN